MAGSLSEADIREIAHYYARQSGPDERNLDRHIKKHHGAAITRGRMLVERNNCAACHGENYNQPTNPDYPKLAGQHGDYLYIAMRAYQTSNPLLGRRHPVMEAQLQNLSQYDLHDIAAYFESLPDGLIQKQK